MRDIHSTQTCVCRGIEGRLTRFSHWWLLTTNGRKNPLSGLLMRFWRVCQECHQPAPGNADAKQRKSA